MTYNERVQAIAGKMAKAKYPGSWSLLTKGQQERIIQEHKEYAAPVAVKHMADAVRLFMDSYIIGMPGDQKEKYLTEQGLIPDNGQEAVKP